MAYGSDIPYSSGYAGYGQLGQGGLGGQTVTRPPGAPAFTGQFPQRPTFPSTPALPYSQGMPGTQQPEEPGVRGVFSSLNGAASSLGSTGGGANIGGIANAVGQGISDFGDIQRLANIDTGQLVDKSFEGQSPFDSVGGFNTQENPFDTRAGAVLGKVGSKAAQGAAIGTSILPGWGCVMAGTKVYTADGRIRNIEDLTKEEGIIGWDGDKAKPEKIIEFQEIGIKPCIELITRKGYSLKCSIDHPIVWSNTDNYKDLSIKVTNGVRTRIKKWDWKEAGNIQLGEQIAIINEVPIFGNKTMFEPRLIGMLIGDGSYSKDKGVRYWSLDKELQDFVEAHGAVCKETRVSSKNDPFKGYSIKGLCDKLRDLGVKDQVGSNKTLPTALWMYDKESISELIGGLYDTDGCVNLDGDRINIKITQISKEIIYSIRDILIRFGIHGNISKADALEKKYKNQIIKSKEYLTFTIRDKNSLLSFYENFKLLIKYKQDKLNLIPELYGNINSRCVTDNGVVFDSIVEINNLGEQEIYNLEVGGSHTYLANNIVTHNTAIGAVAGGIVGGVESIFGGKKHREFEQSQSKAMARYQALKNQQLAYRQKIQNQQAQTNYIAQRMQSSYNY